MLGSHDEDVFLAFEQEFAAWCSTEFALSFDNGTAALLAALFACGTGYGDEIIVPSATSWPVSVPCLRLGATMVFADSNPLTLNIDPSDIEHRITEHTRAIVVVHQFGYPCDMDAISQIAHRHGLMVIEDASHAHGTRYHGRKAGTLGDVAGFSMCGKPIAIGEGGMLVTNNRDLFERAVAWAHGSRFNEKTVRNPALLEYAGLPMGGVTARMNPFAAAAGREQLRHYDERIAEIDRAMNYFWDLLADVEGLIAHRPPADSGSTMGGWYYPQGIVRSDAFEGLSTIRFAQALRAEGYQARVKSSVRQPMHYHPLLNTCDVYHQGKPTRIANALRDVRQPQGSLPNAEQLTALTVPPFRRFYPKLIEEYAACFRKIARNYAELLRDDPGDASVVPDERGNA